ncbi:MAG TPA: alpha/beta hydrolase [Polyangiaceae bacterium]|nr:alpha/beta hydrolase [Polyangiaceae bacterium]
MTKRILGILSSLPAPRRPLLLSIALVAPACGASDDGEAMTFESGRGGSAAILEPDPSGARETAPPAMPFDPPASGYAEMNLYDGDPPNYLASAPVESIDPPNDVISNVSVPTLRRYPVDESKSSGVAFIAFPGGGYQVLDMERAATALAVRLGPLGISVFGLKSRVGGGSTDARRDALLDAERALRLTRSHAAEWGLDPSRIGTVSWSAGSHLALTLAGSFDSGDPASGDAVERESSRPDFMAVMCAWEDDPSTFSFTASTPPIYLCHAEDDTDAPIGDSRAVEQKLQAAGTLEHLEVYETGGHLAFNVGDPTASGRDWPDQYLAWLRTHQLIP